MKTVSTKLDNTLHIQFTELCNNEGKCQSEFLRDLIQYLCENRIDEGNYHLLPQDLEQKPSLKPVVTTIKDKSKPIPKIEIVWK
jgi:hypothetical protein